MSLTLRAQRTRATVGDKPAKDDRGNWVERDVGDASVPTSLPRRPRPYETLEPLRDG